MQQLTQEAPSTAGLADECCICFEHEYEHVTFYPCKHDAVCCRCALKFRTCPLCVQPIEAYGTWEGIYSFLLLLATLDARPPMIIGVCSSDTIDSLFGRVEAWLAIPPVQQRIIYNGKQLLEYGKTLSDYSVKHGDKMHIVGALRGD